MSEVERRTVGERGQVTIPKELREKFGIVGGDEVEIREEGGAIVIETSVSREQLAEGYRTRADRSSELAAELDGISREADDRLGDSPDW